MSEQPPAKRRRIRLNNNGIAKHANAEEISPVSVSPSKVTPLNILYNDLITHIFEFLAHPKQIIILKRVCKNWHSLITSSPHLFSSLLFKDEVLGCGLIDAIFNHVKPGFLEHAVFSTSTGYHAGFLICNYMKQLYYNLKDLELYQHLQRTKQEKLAALEPIELFQADHEHDPTAQPNGVATASLSNNSNNNDSNSKSIPQQQPFNEEYTRKNATSLKTFHLSISTYAENSHNKPFIHDLIPLFTNIQDLLIPFEPRLVVLVFKE